MTERHEAATRLGADSPRAAVYSGIGCGIRLPRGFMIMAAGVRARQSEKHSVLCRTQLIMVDGSGTEMALSQSELPPRRFQRHSDTERTSTTVYNEDDAVWIDDDETFVYVRNSETGETVEPVTLYSFYVKLVDDHGKLMELRK